MSGVGMVVRWDGAPNPPETLKRIAQAAPHRNPPTHHTHGHLTITAHARIDNRPELLPQLQTHLTRPHPTDTQLILAAYQHWGPQTPQHLIGDYAYAIHDTKEHTLHAARDPMGMRPLYYHHTHQRTTITSEIQQILALQGVRVELDEAALVRQLMGDDSDLGATCYVGISSLRAGHRLEVDANGARTHRFWQPDPHHEIHYHHEDDYAHHLRELFLQAVRDRLLPPGPHGLLLSGGVDSGSIAAAMGWLHETEGVTDQVDTFSWAFDALVGCDERGLSSVVTRRYGLAAHAVPAEPNAPLARYPAHGPHRDDPFLGMYQPLLETALATAAGMGIKHLWSGDRGDIVLGRSAPTYPQLVSRQRWRSLGAALTEHVGVTSEPKALVVMRDVVAPVAASGVRRLRRRLGRRVRVSPTDPESGTPWITTYARSLASTTSPVDEWTHEGWAGARAVRLSFVQAPLQYRNMIWSERMNAAFGIGFVDPWSDVRLCEFALAIPQSVLNRPPGPPKRLARAALAGILPDEFRRGARKVFLTPLFDHALKLSARPIVEGLVSSMQAEERGLVSSATLRRHYEAYLAGGRLSDAFWPALSVEMWLRAYWS